MSTPRGVLVSPNDDGGDGCGSSGKPDDDPLISEKVAILSFGSEHSTKLIERKVRELNIEAKVFHPMYTIAEELYYGKYKAIIVSGDQGSLQGSEFVSPYDELIFATKIPILGVCCGFQLMNKVFGGSAEKRKEEGKNATQLTITVDNQNPLFSNLDSQQEVLLPHGDLISTVANGFEVVGKSENVIVAIANVEKKLYGVQFHPEDDRSKNGKEMLKNFLFNVADLSGNFTLKYRVDKSIERIRQLVGTSKVFVLANSGVDSLVSATLLQKALKADQVIALFIDNGLMRKNERAQVEDSLKNVGLTMKTIKSWLQFCNAKTTISLSKTEPNKKMLTKMLCQTTAPEEKRHIIGDTFVRILSDILNDHLKLSPEQKVFFSQGTAFKVLNMGEPPAKSAESTANEDAIKTYPQLETKLAKSLQGNDGLSIVEPLKDFYEDEVRVLGRHLDVPSHQFLDRHPVPVHGLAMRIICAEKPYKEEDFFATTAMLKVIVNYTALQKQKHSMVPQILSVCNAEDIGFLETFSATYKFTSILLPIKIVQGNGNSYGYVVGLSEDVEAEDESEEIITAKFKALARMANLITRICPNVSRVCYIFGSSVKCPVEDITPTTLTPRVIELLREVDNIATEELKKAGHQSVLSAMPIILIPIHFDREVVTTYNYPSCRHSVVISTFITTDDFATGVPAIPNQQIPFKFFKETAEKISQFWGISRVLLDLTSKQSGTAEWE
ncbi:hypothetical protein TYRP_006228 [Tyrophagus putrescentiae]|nr:hypothetical protein TYRP_006228 [Tyrophagus putrescentiae]